MPFLSVRLSVRSVMLLYRHDCIPSILSPSGRAITIVFEPAKAAFQNSKVTISAAGLNARDRKNWRFSTEIAICHGNGTRCPELLLTRNWATAAASCAMHCTICNGVAGPIGPITTHHRYVTTRVSFSSFWKCVTLKLWKIGNATPYANKNG